MDSRDIESLARQALENSEPKPEPKPTTLKERFDANMKDSARRDMERRKHLREIQVEKLRRDRELAKPLTPSGIFGAVLGAYLVGRFVCFVASWLVVGPPPARVIRAMAEAMAAS